MAQEPAITDRLGRPLAELRVSVTDRCNFRCVYCMPREHFQDNAQFVPRSDLLDFAAITRVARVLQRRGLRKVRITGGEPLLRKNVSELVRQLSELPELDLAMTTNGSLLADHAVALREAGLKRITVSLDALDTDVFQRMSDTHYTPKDVLRGIAAAEHAGFTSIKVNCVVKRRVNADQIIPLAEHFRHTPHELRFIEYMDTGETNGWRLSDVVSATEILARVASVHAIRPKSAAYTSQTAELYQYQDGAGTVGVIASVTRPFCTHCTRARLTARGELYTCLFGTKNLDVKRLITLGARDEELDAEISRFWSERSDRYSEQRAHLMSAPTPQPAWNVPVSGLRRSGWHRREMSYLGG